MDLCAGLFLFGLVAFLVAVIGHGLWLFAAAILRPIFGPTPSQLARQRCMRCGVTFFGGDSASAIQLLVPLDFLVLARLMQGKETGPIDWGLELAAVAGLAAVVYRASRILVGSSLNIRRAEWLATVAVVGASASQLLVPRWLDAVQPVPWLFVLLSLGPVLLHVAAAAVIVGALARQDRVTTPQANVLFLFLGLSLFAVAVALGFNVYWSDEPVPTTLPYLAVPIAAVAAPLVFGGILMQQRLQGDANDPGDESTVHGLSPGVARAVGTMLALARMGVMLVTLALAWPRPTALIVVGVINAVVFSAVAIGFTWSAAHVPALACLTLAYLVGFHAARGELGQENANLGAQLVALATQPVTGSALAALAVMLAISSEWFARRRRIIDALYHVASSGCAMFLALLLVATEARASPQRATIVFGLAAVGSFALNARWRQWSISLAGAGVLLGAIVCLFFWIQPELSLSRQWLAALLTHATLLGVACWLLPAVVRRWSSDGVSSLSAAEQDATIFHGTSLVASGLALIAFVDVVAWATLPVCTAYMLWMAAIWLAFAWRAHWPALFAAFQMAVTAAVVLGLTAWLHDRHWLANDLWTWQAYALGLGILSFALVILRRTLSSGEAAHALLRPHFWTVDECASLAVVAGQAGVVLSSVALGLISEIAFGAQQWRPNLPMSAGRLDGTLAWSLTGVLAVALTASLWERWRFFTALGLVVVAVTVAFLVADSFHEERAVSSALRWGLGICFLICSGLIWERNALTNRCRALGIDWAAEADIGAASRRRLVGLTVVPVLAMSAWIAILEFAGMSPAEPDASSFFAQIGWTANMVVPLVMIVGGLTGHGIRENAAGYVLAAGLGGLRVGRGDRRGPLPRPPAAQCAGRAKSEKQRMSAL